MFRELKKEMDRIVFLFEKFCFKCQSLLSTVWGWVSILAIMLVNYFQPALYIYYSIIAIIGIDAILGIMVSKKKGAFILSYLGRETSCKILFYTLLFIAIHIFESVFVSEMNIGLMVAFSIAGAFEIISILANGLILKPDFALFKILIKVLKGEVARKLGVSDEDVEDILKKDKDEL